ncbi:hypothetical protein BD414DRAFT_535738 [Trametes punicea]|nr:hypothetical protein BD414DRAFT_535738 [Trametes punicea]
MHEDINIEPTDREPGKSERPAEDRSTQQTTVSARASGLQRTAKRNAPFLEADQEQDADGHAPGDDEQFLQPKGTKSSVRSESSVKSPSREKRLLITHASDEADVTSPEHARRQRSKRKREKHPPGSKKTFNEAHVTPRAASRHDLRETKCEHRGRRKAASTTSDDDDDQCPVPQYSEPNEPSSPDVPLARLQTSSGKQRAAKALVAKRSKDTVHHIEDDTFLPPRKKVKPLEGERCAPAHNDRKERRPAKHLPPLGSPESEAVRRRAPPVLVSKGTVLKPKPRPRLSLFPVPSLDEDSERDPIDFLS